LPFLFRRFIGPEQAIEAARLPPAQRGKWALIGRGRGIHWETVDEDLSVVNLLAAYSRSKSGDYATATRA
jgi:hypothetical protein